MAQEPTPLISDQLRRQVTDPTERRKAIIEQREHLRLLRFLVIALGVTVLGREAFQIWSTPARSGNLLGLLSFTCLLVACLQLQSRTLVLTAFEAMDTQASDPP